VVASPERRFRRFDLEYFANVVFRCKGVMTEVAAVTKNISLCGLLLESAYSIPCSTPVEFTITVRGKRIVQPVLLAGSGVVVRMKAAESVGKFAIAVDCSEPISQMESPPREEYPDLGAGQVRADL
jgi:hypothetical protein